MHTEHYTTSIEVDQNPEVIFQAIKNFRGWWSEDIEGQSEDLNDIFLYHYKDIHLCKVKLTEEIAGQKLVYKILENHFSFITDQSEWINTHLIFETIKAGNKTILKFTHEGLTPKDECYSVCNEAWTNYINKSLFNLITTGKGNPNPKDAEGFNAALANKWKLE